MAKAKRKTLPKDFDGLLKAGDHAKIIAVLEACRVDAYGGVGDRTALAFAACSDSLTRWLVAQGANLEAQDTWGNTPLQNRITSGGSIDVLLELGATVHHAGGSLGTPLHTAAASHKDALLRKLLDVGAQVDAPDRHGRSALEIAILRAQNAMLPALVRVARMLLEAGAEKRPSMQDALKRVGETFEFHRSGFSRELLEVSSAALQELSALFDAPPVPERVVHDGVASIVPKADRWQKQHAELWSLLVPSKGAASTVLGYLNNNETALTRFLDDGRLPIDNGVVERLHRDVAILHDNCLFAGSYAGGQRAAIALSIIGTCEMLDINPMEYLANVLPELARSNASERELRALLPAAWKAARAPAASAPVGPGAA